MARSISSSERGSKVPVTTTVSCCAAGTGWAGGCGAAGCWATTGKARRNIERNEERNSLLYWARGVGFSSLAWIPKSASAKLHFHGGRPRESKSCIRARPESCPNGNQPMGFRPWPANTAPFRSDFHGGRQRKSKSCIRARLEPCRNGMKLMGFSPWPADRGFHEKAGRCQGNTVESRSEE